MTKWIAVWMLSALLSGKAVKPNRVDLIEVNHHHGYDGKHAYDQVILYIWSPDYRRYDAVGWSLLKSLDDYPSKTGHTWLFNGVRSRTYRETSTYLADPERENEKLFPDTERSKLFQWSR